MKESEYVPKSKLQVSVLIFIIISSFLGVSLLTYFILVNFNADRTVSTASGLISGIFIVLMIMRANGIKIDFKFKAPWIEAELKQNLKNVETEVKNTRQEVEKQMNNISQNIVQLSNSVQLKSHQETKIDMGDISKVMSQMLEMIKTIQKRDLGIDKQTVTVNSNIKFKAKEGLENISEIEKYLKKIVPKAESGDTKDRELSNDELLTEGNNEFYLQKYEKSIEYYDKVLAIEPDNVFASGNKGISLTNLERYDEAIRWYDKALDVDPNYTDAIINKANAIGALGDYEGAVKYINKLLEVKPENVSALGNKGVFLAKQGLYDEAIRWYDKALDVDPDYTDALRSKGIALTNLKRYDEAIRWYDKALENNPNDANTLANKGNSLLHLGHDDNGIKCMNEAVKIEPENAEILALRATHLIDIGKIEQAILDSEKALRMDPESSGVLYNVACVFSIKKEVDRALDLLEKAIVKDQYWKISAKRDKDFNNIKKHPRFKKMVNS